jgi:hypothetical protein
VDLALSLVIMIAVVGTLVGWAFREDRRRKARSE